MSIPATAPPLPGVSAPVDPAAEVEAVLRKLMDQLFVLVVTLGAVTMTATTIRVAVAGYTASYAGDVFAFVVVLGALALRRRLPIRIVAALVFGAITLMGVVSLATLGLASAGMAVLTAATSDRSARGRRGPRLQQPALGDHGIRGPDRGR